MIGLTARWDEEKRRYTVSNDYLRAVEAAGGVPALIPLVPAAVEELAACMAGMDGFEMYSAFDFFLSPTMPAPAGEEANPGIPFRSEYNLNGFPAISIPCGFSTSPPGLPIGLQISAQPFRDAEVLALAYAYESATDWHRRKPAL